MTEYISVAKECRSVTVIERSRFITTLTPIKGYEDAIAAIKRIGSEFSDATHNCYAFISNTAATEMRSSDDGEPQGTAGMPILEVLKKRGVYMTLAVVTRYFGGVKLGANGLVSAYAGCTAQALDEAEMVSNAYSEMIEIRCGYGCYDKIAERVSAKGLITSSDFAEEVTLTAQLKGVDNGALKDAVRDLSSGRARITTLDKKYCEYKLKR